MINGNVADRDDDNAGGDSNAASDPATHPFDKLTPDFILDAMESLGHISDGRLFPLNSYENRVYQIGIEDETPIIGKFYRPNRWSTEQILEEHQFCFELAEKELPVVAPMANKAGKRPWRTKRVKACLSTRAFSLPCFLARVATARNWIISITFICWVNCWGECMLWVLCVPFNIALH